MDTGSLSKLQTADDPEHRESPPDFDWRESIKRVRAVKPLLEEIAGRLLSLNDQVQDATYFADLYVAEEREVNGLKHMRVTFSVSFSCFAALVTIYNENVVPEEKVGRMQSALESQGFVWVDSAVLSELYTGSHAGFQGSTWMDRFFNYT